MKSGSASLTGRANAATFLRICQDALRQIRFTATGQSVLSKADTLHILNLSHAALKATSFYEQDREVVK